MKPHAHPMIPEPNADVLIREGVRRPRNWAAAVLLAGIFFVLLVLVLSIGA